MAEHNKTGKAGEEMAARYLEQIGFTILDRNYRYKRAEVDLIARVNDLLVFVEVKARSTTSYGYPEEFVSRRKTQLFLFAADDYIRRVNWQHDIRFDIVAITAAGNGFEIHHIEDAFH